MIINNSKFNADFELLTITCFGTAHELTKTLRQCGQVRFAVFMSESLVREWSLGTFFFSVRCVEDDPTSLDVFVFDLLDDENEGFGVKR